MNLAQRLQREHLRDLVPYASARRSMSGGSIWLNANESPFTNAYECTSLALNRYPAFQDRALLNAYANYAGVKPEQMLASRGSDEVIELLIKAFCEPKQDSILICPPTYGMYAISAATHGCDTIEVPLQSDGQLAVQAVIEQASNAKLIFLCSPSNPLGNVLRQSDIEQVIQTASNSLIVVDEAYIEFSQASDAQVSATAWLANYPNVVVMRTLSKAFALAAIRCGFAIANADIIDVLRKVIAPYPLPEATTKVAIEALSAEGLATVANQVATLNHERQRLVDAFTNFPWIERIYPSSTNFILMQVPDVARVMNACANAGILLRNQSKQKGLARVVRVSVGSVDENDALLRVLEQFTQEQVV